jgi:hypothetical protein
MVKPDAWMRQLQERPDRPRGRQRRQLDVLVALANQLDAETGKGQVPVLDLAKAAGVSERTVRRAIGWATACGLLEQTSRGHRLGNGTTAASGWLLLGNSESQPASPASQPANSRALQANSQPQPANSTEASKSRPAARRSGNRGTPTPPPVREVLNRAWCTECGFPLDPAVAADGVHPTCATDQPNPTTRSRRTTS